jgi:uncharacterized protein YjiS (DUF1127 family)
MFQLVMQTWGGFVTRLEERDPIRRLQRLDDRMLSDMGIQRSQIQSAVSYQTSRKTL